MHDEEERKNEGKDTASASDRLNEEGANNNGKRDRSDVSPSIFATKSEYSRSSTLKISADVEKCGSNAEECDEYASPPELLSSFGIAVAALTSAGGGDGFELGSDHR
jgi:hypothetical protein